MKILHIVREIRDKWPLELAEAQRKQGHDVALLLIHDAVLTHDAMVAQPPSSIRTFACHDDVVARGVKVKMNAEVVDYDAMVRLIFEYDAVNCW